MVELMRKVRSSTLLEVLIAMVIILVIFTMSLHVFNKVIFAKSTIDRIGVSLQLKRVLHMTKDSVEEGVLIIDSVSYIKMVSPYEDSKDLYEIKIGAYRNEILIDELKLISRIRK